MWFNILPGFFIIMGSVAVPGYGLWWIHYLAVGNCFGPLFTKMWYEILPSFFIITAGLGLPGWGLYHIHNLTIGNHYRRTLLSRWDRAMYQRDARITGSPYIVNALESIPDK